MEIREISYENREIINKFIMSHWFSLNMVVRGKMVNMSELSGLVMYEGKNILGLLTYKLYKNEMEIVSLDSLREKEGIGTALVNRAVKIASCLELNKIKLITTNDNINALRFYQKRGFDMAKLYLNSVDSARKLKPSIPIKGNFDIPIKHEIEFEKILK
ncbi:acetyltransferase [Clostridium acetobutylicum]|nr:acetyltransferase [Clostridium acetobutylicum]